MNASHDQTDLSLEQLEALVSRKKRSITEQKLVRVVQQEEAREPADVASQELRPSRSPESWRGAGGQERLFDSTSLLPLDAEIEGETPAPEPQKKHYTWRDRALLVGEIVALAAFLFILGASLRRVSDLNTEYQQAQQTRVSGQIAAPVDSPTAVLVTPTEIPATPTVAPSPTQALSPTARPTAPSQVVANSTALPTPAPTETGIPTAQPPTPERPTMDTAPTAAALPGVRPEQSETPESGGLGDAEVTATLTPSVTAAPGMPIRIVISAIEVDAPVVEGDSWEMLKLGVGHRAGSAKPGETGNVVLSAHNDVYGEIFRRLHKVEVGDVVVVHTHDASYRYEVISNEIVSPSRVDLMDPTDTPILTLITCYPYMLDTHRVVVRASLMP